jgi:hypothetical protein
MTFVGDMSGDALLAGDLPLAAIEVERRLLVSEFGQDTPNLT